MRYTIRCKSPLLQYTLEYFLKENLSPDGTVITDDPETEGILIGKDIKKPFNKTSLFIQLEKLLPEKEISLDDKIEKMFEKFKKEIIEILKEHYGEK
ncbi:hypothetical protein [Nautilia sp.]